MSAIKSLLRAIKATSESRGPGRRPTCCPSLIGLNIFSRKTFSQSLSMLLCLSYFILSRYAKRSSLHVREISIICSITIYEAGTELFIQSKYRYLPLTMYMLFPTSINSLSLFNSSSLNRNVKLTLHVKYYSWPGVQGSIYLIRLCTHGSVHIFCSLTGKKGARGFMLGTHVEAHL